MAAFSYIIKKCIPPHPSRYTLDTFSHIGEGFYCRAVLSHLTGLAHYRNPSRLIPTPNHAPVAADSAAGRQGVRSTTEGEK